MKQLLFDIFDGIIPILYEICPLVTIYYKNKIIMYDVNHKKIISLAGLSSTELRGIRNDIIWAERKRCFEKLNRDWIGNVYDIREYTYQPLQRQLHSLA